MISIHDIIAFIEYEKYFQSVERAEEMRRRAATAPPRPEPVRRIIRAGQHTRGHERPDGADRASDVRWRRVA